MPIRHAATIITTLFRYLLLWGYFCFCIRYKPLCILDNNFLRNHPHRQISAYTENKYNVHFGMLIMVQVLSPEKVVRTTCPYCGVGCQMQLHIKNNIIYRVEAPFDSGPNYGNLCVKGRFGLDFATHPRRLQHPLIKENGVFREATWDEALDFVAEKLATIVQESGGDSVATYACAKATNEDNYIFQKFVRAVLKTNNVDHCARLCHAGSVTGLQLAIGSSAMSNSIAEMEHLDTFIVTGSNTTETHPVISLFLKKAVRQNGAKLIVIDPRQIELTDFATLWLRQKPGTDVALWQAMAHVVVK